MHTDKKLIWLAVLFAAGGAAQQPYQDINYQSGKLRIQAYLYKPAGNGPFPVVIYNHGSRQGNERRPTPFVYVGNMLAAAGYVVLVPERRGYGTSDGAVYSEDVGNDRGGRFVARMRDETGDVLASLDYLKTLPYADMKRVGIMGWSLGGIVSVFAAGQSPAFRAVVNQAGASLTWNASPEMQKALMDAASRIKVPLLGLVAQNDRTTKAVESVVHEVEKHAPAKLIIYPTYTPPQPPGGNVAPGHAIFAAPGMKIWQGDVTKFLADYLGKP
jgi:dienelactone hydrolase